MRLTAFTDRRFLAIALAVALPIGELAACSHPSSKPNAGAAPVPRDTARIDSLILDTTRTDTSHAKLEHSSAASTRSEGAAGAAPAASPADSQYLKFDATTNTVTFQLVAGPFDFNGFTSGGATLIVPSRSTNVINFEQNDGTPHSAEIATGTGPVPNGGGDPAIPRAYTNKVVEGLPQGATDVMRFSAPDSGSFRLICGVPGHALSGMWIWYKVDPSAKAPSFGKTKS